MPTLISFLAFVFAVLPYQGGLNVTADRMAVNYFMTSRSGTIGLLAHDDKAGEAFTQLQSGDAVTLTYPFDLSTGENKVRRFVVIDTKIYSVGDPYNDPPATTVRYFGYGEALNAYQLFDIIYNSGHGLVLQTCYNGVGGRLFVILEEMEIACSYCGVMR